MVEEQFEQASERIQRSEEPVSGEVRVHMSNNIYTVLSEATCQGLQAFQRILP